MREARPLEASVVDRRGESRASAGTSHAESSLPGVPVRFGRERRDEPVLCHDRDAVARTPSISARLRRHDRGRLERDAIILPGRPGDDQAPCAGAHTEQGTVRPVARLVLHEVADLASPTGVLGGIRNRSLCSSVCGPQ